MQDDESKGSAGRTEKSAPTPRIKLSFKLGKATPSFSIASPAVPAVRRPEANGVDLVPETSDAVSSAPRTPSHGSSAATPLSPALSPHKLEPAGDPSLRSASTASGKVKIKLRLAQRVPAQCPSSLANVQPVSVGTTSPSAPTLASPRLTLTCALPTASLATDPGAARPHPALLARQPQPGKAFATSQGVGVLGPSPAGTDGLSHSPASQLSRPSSQTSPLRDAVRVALEAAEVPNASKPSPEEVTSAPVTVQNSVWPDPPVIKGRVANTGRGGLRIPKKRDFYTILERSIDSLMKKDVYGIFVEPVDATLVPDYLTIITRPMDFGTMRKRIENYEYAQFEQFRDDFVLVCRNAMTYNGPDTIYFKTAQKILAWGTKHFEKERKLVDYSLPFKKVLPRPEPERAQASQGAVDPTRSNSGGSKRRSEEGSLTSSRKRGSDKNDYDSVYGGEDDSECSPSPFGLRRKISGLRSVASSPMPLSDQEILEALDDESRAMTSLVSSTRRKTSHSRSNLRKRPGTSGDDDDETPQVRPRSKARRLYKERMSKVMQEHFPRSPEFWNGLARLDLRDVEPMYEGQCSKQSQREERTEDQPPLVFVRTDGSVHPQSLREFQQWKAANLEDYDDVRWLPEDLAAKSCIIRLFEEGYRAMHPMLPKRSLDHDQMESMNTIFGDPRGEAYVCSVRAFTESHPKLSRYAEAFLNRATMGTSDLLQRTQRAFAETESWLQGDSLDFRYIETMFGPVDVDFIMSEDGMGVYSLGDHLSLLNGKDDRSGNARSSLDSNHHPASDEDEIRGRESPSGRDFARGVSENWEDIRRLASQKRRGNQFECERLASSIRTRLESLTQQDMYKRTEIPVSGGVPPDDHIRTASSAVYALSKATTVPREVASDADGVDASFHLGHSLDVSRRQPVSSGAFAHYGGAARGTTTIVPWK